MINRTFFLLLAGALVGACSAIRSEIPDEHDDYSKLVPKVYELDDFSEIRIDANGKLTIRQSDQFLVKISTEPDHAEQIDVHSFGDRLTISHPARRHHDRHVMIEIESPSLEKIEIDAAVTGQIDEIDSEDFELDFSGVGEVVITGRCQRLDLVVSGVGEMDASEFRCAQARVSVSGVGSTDVYASDTVDIRASGIGDVTVFGAPRVLSRIASGIGSVDFADRRGEEVAPAETPAGYDHPHAEHHETVH